MVSLVLREGVRLLMGISTLHSQELDRVAAEQQQKVVRDVKALSQGDSSSSELKMLYL